jgi:Fe-S-cluster-containing hydrogenase component 2
LVFDEGNERMKEATGILSQEDLKNMLPPEERLKRGTVAIIECVQNIPCNPCVKACKFGAIEKNSLAETPKLNHEKCVGCGECVAVCPGLAIFLVNMAYSKDEALLTLPYEFLPMPKVGDRVIALDREGNEKDEARVVNVRKINSTYIISIAIKKELVMEVRNVRVLR